MGDNEENEIEEYDLQTDKLYYLSFESQTLDEDGDPYRWRHGRYSWDEVRSELMKWLAKPRRDFKVFIEDSSGKKAVL